MFMYGERLPEQNPVVGPYEETTWMQCPVNTQWLVNPTVSFDPSVQCYGNYYNAQYAPYQEYPQIHQQPPPQPIFPNLPCQQTPQWDYNSMCYNVDGQPCQYTNVVDLEDFMNNEKRKEKSRVAARCRRNKEMEIFNELTAALPAKKEEVEQLDKASVMRLAISYLRVRDVVSLLPNMDPEAPQLVNPKGLEDISSELSYMKALDGFVLVLSNQGDIVYCSENISEHLGVSQMEIMGQSVFEFSHPCDHDEVRDALRSSGAARRELLLRLKCTLTNKGRMHLKSAAYKVIHVTGHMLIPEETDNNNIEDIKDDESKKGKPGALVAVGRPIPHPSNIEIPLDSKTFLSKHSLDMKFTYTDESLLNTLGFEPEELVGRSLYDYHHAGDSGLLAHQFKSLFSKGQCETGQYRFLAKTGGYAWVQTQATLITDKQQKPISVVCVNYVISGIECRDEVFAAHQVQHADLKPVVAAPGAADSTPLPVPLLALPADVPNGAIVAAVPPPKEERPIPVTESIFAPREKEMNKGFIYPQIDGFTMLKDEPEALLHLAPTAGDVCIPLENSPFDMFDELILGDNYCSLLEDDLGNGSPVDSLTPDTLLLSSPEPHENDSSCERSSLLTDLSLDAFESGRSDDIDDGHSPFIPTSDELPVLEPRVMWGALPDSVCLARPQPPEPQASPAPALQRLLAAPPTGPPPQDLITNIYSDQGLIPSRSVSSVSTWDTGVKRVMKQEEEPCAKRVKRSPSPAQKPAQSSSVLMNLLDVPQRVPQQMNKLHPNFQIRVNGPNQPNRNIPITVLNLFQAVPNDQIMRTITPNVPNIPVIHKNLSQNTAEELTKNAMSPLSLNIGSPMYSLPSSPNTYSPAMSPAQRDRMLSPYSTPQSLSPIGRYQSSPSSGRLVSPGGIIQGSDPYLTNKMQPSPPFPIQSSDFLDSSLPLTSPDFWTEPELQGTNDLLTAFDDVKLV